ncbi:hypothetical protein BC833DRAFT_574357 [Globomyces pollinis-pini]|nr:hypothetical protein BC833DRAFT_574357 [Globomyces pollinis-pini]
MDVKVVNKSIATVNDCLRHLTWVKSDLASIRQVDVVSPTFSRTFLKAKPPQQLQSFKFDAPLGKFPTTNESDQQSSFANTSANTKRRIDILSTPQFAEVVRYVMAFDDSSEILVLLWTIADGPFLKEDLEIVSNYIKILKMDGSKSHTDTTPEE